MGHFFGINQSLSVQKSPRFICFAISMTTCLILLINVSFKVIMLEGLIFAANSLLCPIIALLYLLALRHCTFKEQRHVLNISLMTLYLFCIGVYVLVNLPASEYMHDNHVYQIIFEDIPKKFFATTVAFVLSFYLPHVLLGGKSNRVVLSPRQYLLLALLGGISFFCLDFYLLFSGPHAHSFKQVFIDSFMIASLLLLIMGVCYLYFPLDTKPPEALQRDPKDAILPVYDYLLCFAVAIILMCIACEYRIVALSKEVILSASCIFFPIALVISTCIGELWGYRANLKLAIALIATQFIFDALLMGIVAFPSPAFFNLNPFYNYIMPRRLMASSFSLFAAFFSNALLLHYLKESQWKLPQPLRILVASICANSLLCLVDYSVLFGGIYPYEQIMNLVMSVWSYKFGMTFISLPLILWLCKTSLLNFTISKSLRY